MQSINDTAPAQQCTDVVRTCPDCDQPIDTHAARCPIADQLADQAVLDAAWLASLPGDPDSVSRPATLVERLESGACAATRTHLMAAIGAPYRYLHCTLHGWSCSEGAIA